MISIFAVNIQHKTAFIVTNDSLLRQHPTDRRKLERKTSVESEMT